MTLGFSLLVIGIFSSLLLLYKRTSKKNTVFKPATVRVKVTAALSDGMIVTPSMPQVHEQREIPEQLKAFELLTLQQKSHQELTEQSDIINHYRKPHPLLIPLTQRVFEPNELFELIKKDPEITAKILTVVNSSQFSLRQPITSVNHAIIFLGVTTVKNVALQCAIAGSTDFENPHQQQAFNKIWQISYIASAIGFTIAKELGLDNAAEIATQSLLAYLGDMAIIAYRPEFAEIYLNTPDLFARLEKLQQQLNTNPAVIGSLMAKNWQLPRSIVYAIENSLHPLVNKLDCQETPYIQPKDCLISYIACRLAEQHVYHGLADLSSVKMFHSQHNPNVAFAYLSEQLTALNLTKINALIATPQLIKKVNTIFNPN